MGKVIKTCFSGNEFIFPGRPQSTHFRTVRRWRNDTWVREKPDRNETHARVQQQVSISSRSERQSDGRATDTRFTNSFTPFWSTSIGFFFPFSIIHRYPVPTAAPSMMYVFKIKLLVIQNSFEFQARRWEQNLIRWLFIRRILTRNIPD